MSEGVPRQEQVPAPEKEKQLTKIRVNKVEGGTTDPFDVEVVRLEMNSYGAPVLKYKLLKGAFGATYEADYVNGEWIAEPMD